MQWRLTGIGLLLLAAGCVGGTGAAPQTATTFAPAQSPGRLVILDDQGDVVVMDRDGSTRVALTDDAGSSVRYLQPTWAPGSERLAWGEFGSSGTGLVVASGEGGDRASVPMGAPPFYLYWSPDAARIGVLHNSPEGGGIDLEIVEVESATTEVVLKGQPLYFSWSPDSDRIAAHFDGVGLTAFGVDGGGQGLGETRPGYQAPVWGGDGVVHLGETGLEVTGIEVQPRTLAEVPEPLVFLVSPGGDRIAIQSFGQPDVIEASVRAQPTVTPGVVSVLDLDAGTSTAITETRAIAFWWSPDGRSLLLLMPQPDRLDVAVWSDGERRGLGNFRPAPAFVREVLPFFDQYAQSWRVWSPDSTAVALAGTVEGETGVWVFPVDGSAPRLVAEGSWAAWSDR